MTAPYPDAGTLFPRSVCRDSGTETLGEQTIRPKPGLSPCLRNRLRRLQGARPRCFRNWLLKRPPGPLGNGACAVVRANFCLSATASGRRGAFKETRSRGLGDFIGIVWKGTRIPAYLAEHLCCFDAAERMWRSRESKIYQRYPSELHLANALKSVTVVAIWLPEKNGLSESSDKPLI